MKRDATTVHIAVLSRDKEEEKIINEAKGTLNASLIFVPTMQQLHDVLLERPCNGVLFCLGSLVGIDQSSKSFVQTLEQVYPVARVRWNKAKGFLGLIASRGGRVESLPDFMTICSNFTPRRLRRSERLVKTLNVLISATPDLANSTRAFTMNISVRGCFLHTPHEWKIGDTVYLQILELPAKRVIEGKVIRSIQWGVPFTVQGIGVQFSIAGNEQIDELQRLLYSPPAGPPGKVASSSTPR
jgi:Tfp pilus assembly protein PilZ